MSLAQATQNISEHPGATAVNAPTVKENKDADIARKLKLYGAVKALQAGSLPSNAQLDSYLVYLEKHSLVDPAKLSEDGKILIEDLRDVMETCREMIKQRNGDEIIQDFIAGTNETPLQPLSKDAVPVSPGDIKSDAKSAAPHLRTLLTLFLTNAEARKILNDLGTVGRDIFANVAVKAAEKARPGEEELRNVDREGEAGRWIGAEGKTHGRDSTPNLELNVGGHKVVHDPKAPASSGTVYTDPNGGHRTTAGEAYSSARDAREQYVEGKEQLKGEAFDQAKQAGRAHGERGTEGVKEFGRERAEQGREVLEEGRERADDEDTKRTVKERFNDFRDRVSPGEENQHRIRAQREHAKHLLDEQFPQERRDQFIWRLKKVVVEVQKHGDYDEAMNTFLDLFSTYKGHTSALASAASSHTASQSSDPAFQRSWDQLQTILARSANGHGIDGILRAVDNIYAAAKEDELLRNYFSQLDEFVRKCLLEPGYILDDDCTDEGRVLREQGHDFFDQKYRSQKDALFDEISAYFKDVANDPLNQTLSNDFQRLTKDLLFNDKGTLEFKPQLWNDLRSQFLPSIIEHVGYVPIPRIEYSDKPLDLVIENLVLEGSNLFPNIIEFEAENKFRFSPYKTIADKSSHQIHLHFSQVQADLRDVGFFLKKKTGFPKIQDSGLADVLMAGEGLSVAVVLLATSGRTDSVFEVKSVHAKVGTLKIAIRGTKKDWLYKLFSSTASGLIKKAIGKAVEQSVRTSLGYIDQQLVGVRNRMDEAKDSDELTRTQVLKELFQKKKEDAEANKRKVESKAAERDSKFAIVTDREKSILPDENPPVSIAADTWKKEDVAKKDASKSGDWHNRAFDL
ncbi:hypothetical protein BDY24DRAFT_121689 [Mrakia frigida]|uniref:uncharacterized protein n=1 Tax=Mrakia frigida TaxID=29902 RepID=UPI003FCC136E